MTSDTVTLEKLRQRITDLDRQLIALVAERKAVSEEVARVKRATGRPTLILSDPQHEIRHLLAGDGLAPEQLPGVCFVDALAAIAPQLKSLERPWLGTFHRADHELLLPDSRIPGSLALVPLRRPPGVIFDVGSLKSPLRAGLLALKSHGCRVASVHPMFGPDTELLSGRHVVFVDLGHEAALASVRELFAPTLAEQVVMSLDEHDRLIAYVLGLSHALNIAFFTALAESGEAAPKLARMSSTTFDAQLEVASHVAEDSPELYYEIQSLNDYGAESLEALSQAIERVRTSVLSQDHDTFVALMRRGREYLEDRRSLTERRA